MKPYQATQQSSGFKRRIVFERLEKLAAHTVEDLVNNGFIKGLKVVLDSEPVKARCRRCPHARFYSYSLMIFKE
jgi:hypothetical protein